MLLAVLTRSTAEAQAVPAAAAPAAAQASSVDMRSMDSHTYKAVAVRLPRGAAPRVDGRLDDEVWALAPPFGNFIQREPSVGAPTTERTEFKVLYDDARMYFAIWAYESDQNGIVASEMLRDSALRKGDAVRIVLDTFHDHRNTFYFSTNPLGAQKDGYATENGRMNWNWNAVWEVKTTRDDQGWYSEFSIPLSQIRFKSSTDEQVWGFNVGRIIIHKREETHYVPYPREWAGGGIYRASGLGLLEGLQDLKARRRLEFVPFVSPQVSRDYDGGTPTTWKRGVGADFRLGVTQTLNADVTYRTDFAQVEADQEVVNLTRFNLFFPEKRQFFTEGSGTFAFGLNGDEGGAASVGGAGGDAGLLPLLYTRTIGLSSDGREVPIVGGGRVAGAAGPYTIGFMNIETDETDYAIGGRTVHIPRANYTVARVRRNVLKSSTIGVIGLNRQGDIGGDSYNRSLGVDGVFSLGNNVKLVGLLAKTFSPDIHSDDMAGVASAEWSTDRWGAAGTYADVQQGFNAQMGFIPRTGIRRSSGNVSWTPRPRWPGVRQLSMSGTTDYVENHQGVLESRDNIASFALTRNDQSSIRFSLTNAFDLLPTPFRVGPKSVPVGEYDWNTFSATYNSDNSRRAYGGGGFDAGGYYGGDKRTFRANLNFLPMETLLIENSYTRNHISLPGASTYHTNTLNTRVSYSLSPNLFFKTFVQYNSDRRLMNLNLLLWSIYRPGSDFYVVYNHGWETDAPGPHALRVRNRLLAVKLTYWLSR